MESTRPAIVFPFTDVDVPQPDEKSIITYVSSLYDAMPRVPDVQDGVKANVSVANEKVTEGGAPKGSWWLTTRCGFGEPPVGCHSFSLPPPHQEFQLRWQEYSEVVRLLLQWIQHHAVVFEERKIPASYEEIEVRTLPEPGNEWGLTCNWLVTHLGFRNIALNVRSHHFPERRTRT